MTAANKTGEVHFDEDKKECILMKTKKSNTAIIREKMLPGDLKTTRFPATSQTKLIFEFNRDQQQTKSFLTIKQE